MQKKGKIWIYIVRILLSVACVLMVAFIFSNSLKTGAVSLADSSSVVNTVKDYAGVLAPDSKVANATGTGYEKLHAFVRRMAHFSEFAVFGVLLVSCYFSFTHRKKWLFCPAIAIIGVAVTDELLQGRVPGRVSDIADVVMDVLGGFSGGMVAMAVILWIFLLHAKRLRQYQKIEELGVDMVVVKRMKW